ncbi:MAG: hypothetical protein JJU02_16390 [Cryomorphaceae bacterium]|nr:hypothetical protein [Cryomorphaceae bacterium]
MIKNLKLLAVFIPLLLAGCERCNDFENGEITNDGMIVFDIQLSRCYGTAVARGQDGGMHIRNRDQFLSLFPKRTAACAIGDSLDVNFSQYDLLAYVTKGICNTKLEREVRIEPQTSVITYSIRQTDCGRCGTENVNYNLVAIPMVEDGYVVRFDFSKN